MAGRRSGGRGRSAAAITAISLAAVASAVGVGCGGHSPKPPLAERDGLQVLSGYAYPTMGTAGAAYLHIRNDGNSADTLLEVLAEGQAGMLMTTEGTRMIMVSREAISPGADVTMRPGGMHLMFEGLRTSTTVGDTVPLTLRFARAGELGVRVPVVAYGEMP